MASSLQGATRSRQLSSNVTLTTLPLLIIWRFQFQVWVDWPSSYTFSNFVTELWGSYKCIVSRPINNVIITPVPSGQRKLYSPQATLFHLRSALSCLRAASTYGLRRPSGRIMHSEGGIMWPEGSIISFGLRARV